MTGYGLAQDAMRAIREHGWIRSRYGDPDRGFCVSGALRYALANHLPEGQRGKEGPANYLELEYVHALEIINTHIQVICPGAPSYVPEWNDYYASQSDIKKLVESFIGPKPRLWRRRARPVTEDPAHEFTMSG